MKSTAHIADSPKNSAKSDASEARGPTDRAPAVAPSGAVGVLGNQAAQHAMGADGPPPLFPGATGPPQRSVRFGPQMARAFNQDFSDLQNLTAARSALAGIGAAAATDGERIAFSRADPDRRQVAHELAHVVQFRRAGSRSNRPAALLNDPDSPAETEARRVARRVAAGGSAGTISATPTARVHRDPPPGEAAVCEEDPFTGTFVLDPALRESTPDSMATQVRITAPGGDPGADTYVQLDRDVLSSTRITVYAVPIQFVYETADEAAAATTCDMNRQPPLLTEGQQAWTASGTFSVATIIGDTVLTRDPVAEAVGAGAVVLLETDAGAVLIDAGLQLQDPGVGEPIATAMVTALTPHVSTGIGEVILAQNAPSGGLLPHLAAYFNIQSIRATVDQYAAGDVSTIIRAQQEYRQWLVSHLRDELTAQRAAWERTQPIAPNESIREERWQTHLQSELAAVLGPTTPTAPPSLRLAETDASGTLQMFPGEFSAAGLITDEHGLPDLSDVEWEPADEGAVIFGDRNRLTVAPARGLVLQPALRRIPEVAPTGPMGPGPRAPVTVTPWLAMAAVGKEGQLMVRTSMGHGVLVDVGGRPRLVAMEAIGAISGELSVTSVESILITHPHTDHVRYLLEVIKNQGVQPANLVLARAWRGAEIVDALRTTTDPRLLELGYGPEWQPSFAAATQGVTHTRVNVGGAEIDVYARGEAHETYRRQLREVETGQRRAVSSERVDSASLLYIVGNESSANRTAIFGDFRGSDITATRDALGTEGFAEAMRNVRIIKGVGHHFSQTAGRTPADIAGLDLLIEHTLVRNGELTIMVQSTEGFAFGGSPTAEGEGGALLRYFVRQGARVVFAGAASDAQRSGTGHSGVTVDSAGQVTTTGEAVQVFSGADPRIAAMHRRLGILREARRTIAESPEFGPTALDMAERDATELTTELDTEIRRLEDLSRELRGHAGADLFEARQQATGTRAAAERTGFRSGRTTAGRGVDDILSDMEQRGPVERALSDPVLERLALAAERGRSVAIDIEFAQTPRSVFEALESLPEARRRSLGEKYREMAERTRTFDAGLVPEGERLEVLARAMALRNELELAVEEAPADRRALFEGELERMRTAVNRLSADTVSVVELGRDILGRRTRTEYIRAAGNNLVVRGFHEMGRGFGALMVIHSVQELGELAGEASMGDVNLTEGALRLTHSAYGLNIGVRMVRATQARIAAAQTAGRAAPGVRGWEFAIMAVIEVGIAAAADYESSEQRDAAIASTALHSSVNLLCMYAGQAVMTWAAASPLLAHPLAKAAGMGLGLAIMFAGETILSWLGLDDNIQRWTSFPPGEVTDVNREIGKVLEDYRVMIGTHLLRQRSDSELRALGVHDPVALRSGAWTTGNIRAAAVRGKEDELMGLFEDAYRRVRGSFVGLRMLDAQAAEFTRLRHLAMQGRDDPNRESIEHRFRQIDERLDLSGASDATIRGMEQWEDLDDKLDELGEELAAETVDFDDLLESYEELELMMENARYRLESGSRGGLRPAPLLPEGSAARAAYMEELRPRESRLARYHARLSQVAGGARVIPGADLEVDPRASYTRLRGLRQQYYERTTELAGALPQLSNAETWNDPATLADAVVDANRGHAGAFQRLRLAEMNLRSAARQASSALVLADQAPPAALRRLIVEEVETVPRLIHERRMGHGLIFIHELDSVLEQRGADEDRILAAEVDAAFPPAHGRRSGGTPASPFDEEEISALEVPAVRMITGPLSSTEHQLRELRARLAPMRSFTPGKDPLDDYQLLHRVVDRQYARLRTPYRTYDEGWLWDSFPEHSFDSDLNPLVVLAGGSRLGATDNSLLSGPRWYHTVLAVNADAVRVLGTGAHLIRMDDLAGISQEDIQERARQQGQQER